MDTLSHALWGWGLFGYRGRPRWAFFFGAFPDLISFGLLIAVDAFTGPFRFGKPKLEEIPGWLFPLYDFSHSFIVAFFFLIVVSLWSKNAGFVMWAWIFHICLDIPFHAKAYFPTKMFWPVSDFCVDGVSWATPWVWYPNIAALVLLFTFRFAKRKI